MLRPSAICFLFIITASFGFSQSSNAIGLLPRLQVATKLNNKFTLINIMETRHYVYNSKLADKRSVQYRFTDFSAFLNYKISKTISFNAAYTLRVAPDLFSHRAIEQMLVANDFKGFSLQQRLGLDQTFNQEDFAIFRARYRYSFIIPLQGKSIEEKECYLNLTNEYIVSIQNKVFDVELRLIPKLGYMLNAKNKFEFGLDYRVSEFINKETQHVYWWNFTWFASINPKDKIVLRNFND